TGGRQVSRPGQLGSVIVDVLKKLVRRYLDRVLLTLCDLFAFKKVSLNRKGGKGFREGRKEILSNRLAPQHRVISRRHDEREQERYAEAADDGDGERLQKLRAGADGEREREHT